MPLRIASCTSGDRKLHEALALQLLLVRVHGPGDIHGENQREIDLRVGLNMEAPRNQRPYGNEGDLPPVWAHHATLSRA